MATSPQNPPTVLVKAEEPARLRTLLRRVYNWLAAADPVSNADMIFALAGRRSRKLYVLRLFDEGRAPRILLSTGRFEIRRFSDLSLPLPVDLMRIASLIPPPQRHFFVCFEGQQVEVKRIPVRRFGTLGEIQALADWLHDRPRIKSLAIISSGPHLRRVRMCCRAVLPEQLQLRLMAVPEESQWLNARSWWREWSALSLVLSEVLKLLLYQVVLAPSSIRRILFHNHPV